MTKERFCKTDIFIFFIMFNLNSWVFAFPSEMCQDFFVELVFYV